MTVTLATTAFQNKLFRTQVVLLAQVVANVLVITGAQLVLVWAHLTYKEQMITESEKLRLQPPLSQLVGTLTLSTPPLNTSATQKCTSINVRKVTFAQLQVQAGHLQQLINAQSAHSVTPVIPPLPLVVQVTTNQTQCKTDASNVQKATSVHQQSKKT